MTGTPVDALDPPLRVLLCDDGAELRSLLRSALESHGGVEVVGEAADGGTAVRLAAERRPEVVVLDLEMPGPSADELLDLLHGAAPASAIVTFSGHEPRWVAPHSAHRIDLHVPKTTELSTVWRALVDLVGTRRAQ